MARLIDFSNCPVIPGQAYNGANGKKIAVEYLGQQYMLKFPPSGENKHTTLSYTNSCISEYLGSSIFNLLGITAQETLLGTYEVSGKSKVVCACRDFTADGSRLLVPLRTQFWTLTPTGAGQSCQISWRPSRSSSSFPPHCCLATSGMCSWRTRCLEILTGTTGIGGSWSLPAAEIFLWRPFMTVGVVCCLRPMSGL